MTVDPLVARARLLHGSDKALGALSPWNRLRFRAGASPRARSRRSPAPVRPTTSTECRPSASPPTTRGSRSGSRSCAAPSSTWTRAGRSPRGRPTTGRARSTRTSRSAARSGSSRDDLLNFCRLTDADGAGTSGWTKHLKTLDEPRREAHEARPDRPRAARPGHFPRRRPQSRHRVARRAGDDEGRPRHCSEHADRRGASRARRRARRTARSAARSRSRSAAGSSRASAVSSPAAGLCASKPPPKPIATSSPRTSTPTREDAGSASSLSSTRRRGSARPGGSTTTRCLDENAARAHRLRQRLRRHARRVIPRGRQQVADAPRRHDRKPEARGDRHRPARQTDPAHPRRSLAGLKLR